MFPPAVYKEISSTGELYVYMNGSLLYKKWPDGSSIIFEKYGVPTHSKNRTNGHY